jgi:alanyl-tRNA synthetase
MGGQDPDHADIPYSMELCGGTHVRRTGDIGLIKIISESAVSSGVRRIEGVTGAAAMAYLNEQIDQLKQTATVLKSGIADVPSRVESLLFERKKMEKEISELRRKLATSGGASDALSTSAGAKVKDVNGTPYTSRIMADMPAKELKPMADEMKAELGTAVITLIAVNEGRASIVVAVTDDLTDKVNAVDLVRVGAEKLGGKGGGGRPDMAQAGGPDGDAANGAVSAIEAALAG